MSEIEKKCKEYYSKQNLSSESVEKILSSVENVEREKPWWIRHRNTLLRVAIVFFVVGIIFTHSLKDANKKDMSYMVAHEVVKNHKKQLQPEIITTSYDEVQGHLSRMSVSVKPGDNFVQGFDLIGGRYCSVLGELAAQLTVRDHESGRMGSLYVSATESTLKRLNPTSHTIKDHKVHIWKDGPRLFYLVLEQ